MRRIVCVAMLAAPLPCAAQEQAQEAPAAPAADPLWVASVSGGAIDGAGATHGYGTVALSRRLGRGYARLSATVLRSTARETAGTPASDFALGSIGGGGTFGQWFVDSYAGWGRQFYRGVGTASASPSATAPPSDGGDGTPPTATATAIGDSSAVVTAGLSGGRFVALGGGWYLTPSVAAQYSRFRTRQLVEGPTGPQDGDPQQRAWTASGTLRADRFFGSDRTSFAGVSASHVHASSSIATPQMAGDGTTVATGMPDDWIVLGASGALKVGRAMWIDLSVSRTAGATAGDVTVAGAGVRLGF